MPATVYVETSVISYLVARPTSDVIVTAHQEITQRWWSERRSLFMLYVSALVVDEASGGDPSAAARRVALLSNIPKLQASERVDNLARRILRDARLPQCAAADAAHVAIAAVHTIDYLLTWNVRHIANAEVRRSVESACRSEGFAAPVLCTPEELMGHD